MAFLRLCEGLLASSMSLHLPNQLEQTAYMIPLRRFALARIKRLRWSKLHPAPSCTLQKSGRDEYDMLAHFTLQLRLSFEGSDVHRAVPSPQPC